MTARAPGRDLGRALPQLRRIARRFRPHIRPQRRLIVLGLLALVAEVGFRLLEPWPLAYVLDAIVTASGADLAARSTAVENLPAITAVQLLVNSRQVDTLAGHVDVRRPLAKDLRWTELPRGTETRTASGATSVAPQ